MPRTSVVHYIAPSAISITPNANASASDLAVYVTEGANIKVYSPRAGINTASDGSYQEWTLSGRNRRLADGLVPYTIYVRINKTDHDDAYLLFVAKSDVGGVWKDKYPYITPNGIFTDTVNPMDVNYWYVRLGDVTAPDNGRRTVSYDTGVLGTDLFNTEWSLNPDALPLRVGLGCTIDDEDAGSNPYVFWNKSAVLVATLTEGWTGTTSERFDHWEILRDSGVADADAEWNAVDRSANFGVTGMITLSHGRTPAVDDFNGAVSTTFTVRAMGRQKDAADNSTELVVLASGYITIMSETLEKYELVTSADFVSWNPMSGAYTPAEGVTVNIRSIDQRGDVVKITKGKLDTVGLAVSYRQADGHTWTDLLFDNPQASVAEAVIPIAAFEAQKPVDVHIVSPSGMEMSYKTVGFLRDGEDSRDREWIYLRSETAIAFGDSHSSHPLPSLIEYGEVEPGEHAAGHVTNQKNQDGWVPEGWWDEMRGTDDTNHYEYASHRDYIREDVASGTEAHWGDFSKPVPWAYSAEDVVNYRCRWTLDDVETWQLTASYTGAFRGALPLVATLMKRVGNDSEQAVTAQPTIISVVFDGIDDEPYVFSQQEPRFVIDDDEHSEFIAFLNNSALTAITITFSIGGEEYSYSIPVIREADEESVVHTVEQYASNLFLSKKNDDMAEGNITFKKNVDVQGDASVGSNLGVKGWIKSVIGYFNTLMSDNYTGDSIADTGYRLTNNNNGHSKLTVDEIYVRMKAVYESLEVRERTYTGGDQIWSCAGNKIVRVDYMGNTETDVHSPMMMWCRADGSPVSGGTAAEPVVTVPIPGETYGYSEVKVPWLLRGLPTFLSRSLSALGIFSSIRKVRIVINDEQTQTNGNRAAAATPLGSIRRARCYFLATDGDGNEVHNWWRINDLARCQTMNMENINRQTYLSGEDQKQGNIFWWRKVIGVSFEPVTLEDGKQYHYFDVAFDYELEKAHPEQMAMSVYEGSDIPAASDSVVQFGNTIIEGRMNLMMMEVNGGDAVGYSPSSDAPCLKAYRGIYSFDLSKSWIGGQCCKMKLSPKTGYDFYGPHFKQVTEYDVVPVPVDRGLWINITLASDDYGHGNVRKCYYYDKVSHGGQYWLCSIVDGAHWVDASGNYISESDYAALTDEQKATCARHQNYTTDEPSEDSSDWTLVVSRGQDGVGYVATEEYYVLSNSGTTVPSGHPYTGNQPYKKYTATEWQQVQITGGWNESRPTYQGDTNKYIWNFEVSFDTDGNAMVTPPICIGDYSKGIASIVETYTISSHVTKAAMLEDTAERTAHPWVDDTQDSAPTAALPYQWNKTVTTYSDGTSDTTYHISAARGSNGDDADVWTIGEDGYWYKNGVRQDTKAEGTSGKDGWMVTAAPANVIITQNMVTTSTFTAAVVSFSAKKGSGATLLPTAIGTPVWNHFTGSKNDTDKTVTVTAPAADNGEYYTEGSLAVDVSFTDPDTGNTVTFNVTVLCYANLLGKWTQTIEDGIEKSVATKLGFVDPGTGAYSIQYAGSFIRGWAENTSVLTKKIDGVNLLTGTGDGDGWISVDCSMVFSTNDMVFSMIDVNDEGSIYSPTLLLEPETYTISYIDEAGIGNARLMYNSINVPGYSMSEYLNLTWSESNGRRVATFAVSVETYVSLRIWDTESQDPLFAKPQLEKGNNMTEWQPNPLYVTQSEIKQTAENIQTQVSNKVSISAFNQRASSIETLVRKSSGSNRLTNVDTGSGWLNGNGNNIYPTTENGNIKYTSSDGVYSPVIFLSKGKYVCSFVVNSGDAASRYVDVLGSTTKKTIQQFINGDYDDLYLSDSWSTDGEKYWFTFELTEDEYVCLEYNGSSYIQNPQIDPGAMPSTFNVGKGVDESYIRQTVDEIDLGIRNALGETGINIKGGNRSITAKANNFSVRNAITSADALFERTDNTKVMGDTYERAVTAGETFGIDKYGTLTSPVGAMIDGAVLKRQTKIVQVENDIRGGTYYPFRYAGWFRTIFKRTISGNDYIYTLDSVSALCDMIVLMNQFGISQYSDVKVWMPVAKLMIGQELTIINATYESANPISYPNVYLCLVDIIEASEITPEWAWGNTPYGFLWPMVAGNDFARTYNILDITEYSSITLRAVEPGFDAQGIGSDSDTGEWVVVNAIKREQ